MPIPWVLQAVSALPIVFQRCEFTEGRPRWRVPNRLLQRPGKRTLYNMSCHEHEFLPAIFSDAWSLGVVEKKGSCVETKTWEPLYCSPAEAKNCHCEYFFSQRPELEYSSQFKRIAADFAVNLENDVQGLRENDWVIRNGVNATSRFHHLIDLLNRGHGMAAELRTSTRCSELKASKMQQQQQQRCQTFAKMEERESWLPRRDTSRIFATPLSTSRWS